MQKIDVIDAINTEEASRLLSVCIRRVQQLIQQGILPAQHKGRDWLIQRADLALAEARNRKSGRKKKQNK